MRVLDSDAYAARSGALDLSAFAWEDVPRFPLPAAAVRTLRYMQDIESHTKVDETIRRLPGFATAGLLEAWIDRDVGWADVYGGCNGNGHH